MKNDESGLSHSLTLPARMASFDAFMAFVRQTAESLNIRAPVISKFELAAEELLVNVVHYAYAGSDAPGDIEMRCGMAAPDMFCMEVRDKGAPFNPLQAGTPDLSGSMDERPVGGLGIFLVRELADRLDYYREENTNTIVFCKSIAPQNGA